MTEMYDGFDSESVEVRTNDVFFFFRHFFGTRKSCTVRRATGPYFCHQTSAPRACRLSLGDVTLCVEHSERILHPLFQIK